MKGIGFGIIILIILAIMFSGQMIYESDLRAGDVKTPENLVIILEEVFVYDSNNTYKFEQNLSNLTNIDMTELKTERVDRILNSFTNFAIITTFETSKFLVEYGYTHPEYDFEFYVDFVKYILVALIILTLIPVLIPLIALIYLIYLGIKNVTLATIKFFKERNIKKKEIENGFL